MLRAPDLSDPCCANCGIRVDLPRSVRAEWTVYCSDRCMPAPSRYALHQRRLEELGRGGAR